MTPLSPASLSLSSASSLSFSCLLWVSFIPVGFFSCLSSSSKTVFSLPSFTSSSIFFFSSFSSSSLFLSPRLFLSLLFSSVSPRSLLLSAYSRFFSLLSLLLLSPYQSLPSFFSSGFFSLLVPSFSLPVSFFLYSFPLFLPRLFSASHILGFFHFILFLFSIPCLFLLSLLRVCFSLLLPSVFPVALLLPFSLQSSPAWQCFGYISSTLIDIHAQPRSNQMKSLVMCRTIRGRPGTLIRRCVGRPLIGTEEAQPQPQPQPQSIFRVPPPIPQALIDNSTSSSDDSTQPPDVVYETTIINVGEETASRPQKCG